MKFNKKKYFNPHIVKYIIPILSLYVFLISFEGCQSKNEEKNNSKSSKKYIAYYFHPTARCLECLNLESFLKELIETKYSDKGFDFKPLNIENEENQHFKNDFKLTFSSVVITEYESDSLKQWIRLDSVWSFCYNKEDFFKYTEKEINNFINQK